MVVGFVVAAASETAFAQGGGVVGSDGHRSIGVGVEQTLGGISGATFVYDAGIFHIDGILGFANRDTGGPDDQRTIALAGRFLYLISRAERADLGVGGGLGIVNVSQGDQDATAIDIEVMAQIRAFLVPNVALSASLGLVILSGDAPDAIIFGGQLGGAFGLTYFF